MPRTRHTTAKQPTRAAPRVVAVIADVRETPYREAAKGVAQFGCEAGDWQIEILPEEAAQFTALPAWREGGFDGIIALVRHEAVARAVIDTGLPAVGLGTPCTRGIEASLSHVDADNTRIASLAFEHLRERGLTNFGFYAEPVGDPETASILRGDTFAALAAAGGYRCARLVARSAPNRGAPPAELCRWLAELPKPVGIMACHDPYARQVLDACRATGLRVPQEVAVIGVDDDDLECELAVPPLSSIAHASRRLGYEAARLLAEQFAAGRSGRQPTTPVFVPVPPVGIVARASTDTFAVADPAVARVIAAVRQRSTEGLSIADLVAISGTSRWRLQRRFRELVGHSLHDEVLRAKLMEAQRLIRNTDLPLKAVASRSGFSSVAYMTTVFRRWFDITPAQFRRVEQRADVRVVRSLGGMQPPRQDRR
jgi:LacI family transcriptional regulator